jgi:hypothetical protein
VSFTFICNNIPAAPAYGVYISQLIQHSSSICIWCIHLSVDTTFQQHLHIVYTSLSWYNIPVAPVYGVCISQLIRHSSSTCIWCIHLSVDTTFQQQMHMVYSSLSWYDIPAAPAYGVYISQLMRYSIACCCYHGFLHIGLQLTRKLLKQGFPVVKLKVVRSPTWLG